MCVCVCVCACVRVCVSVRACVCECVRMFECVHEGYLNQKMFVSSQVKLSFIVIPLHVWTYSGTRCRASQDHGAT